MKYKTGYLVQVPERPWNNQIFKTMSAAMKHAAKSIQWGFKVKILPKGNHRNPQWIPTVSESREDKK